MLRVIAFVVLLGFVACDLADEFPPEVGAPAGPAHPADPGDPADSVDSLDYIDDQLSEEPVDVNPFILGGFPIKITAVPYQVSLRLKKNFICGGALLNRNTVVTAAQCVLEACPQDLTVGLGSENRLKSIFVKVSAIHRHPDFSKLTLHNDIAVLKLSSNVTYNTRIQPIPMATVEPKKGSRALVTGWGVMTDGTLATTLRALSTTIWDRLVCKLWNIIQFTKNVICTTAMSYRGTCSGDSGGPLVVDGELVGLVSFSHRNCSVAYPDYYSNVAALRSFVTQYL